MLLSEVNQLLGGEVIWGRELAARLWVESCFAADLMSDVLAFAQPGALLLTGLASVQAAHAADVADLVAVLFVGGKRPGEAVRELAAVKGIPLVTTEKSLYEACGILHQAGLRPGHRHSSGASPEGP